MTDRARRLRREATPEERLLWPRLSRIRPAFTRQLSIDDRFVADFACRRARLIVELDGSQHVESARDATRTRALAALGWTVMRFWNGDVRANPDGVAEAILAALTDRLPEPPSFTPSRAGRQRSPRTRGKNEKDRK